jgi:serine/threonine protein kinase
MSVYDDIFDRPSVGGRYKFLKRLGSGAFGEVFLADQEIAGVPGIKFRQVAIKMFTQEYITAGNAEKVFAEALLLERLAQEARTRGDAVHLVTIFDLGILRDYSGAPFVAMECVYGSLEKQLASAPMLPLAAAIRLMRGVCAGLALAHGHNPAYLHRDLKPANVLIERSGFLKVADFGLAIDRYQAYLAGGSAGTISYCPPESRGHGVPTPAFDVYSLGIMMLEMLARRNPLAEVLSGLGTEKAQVEKVLDRAQASLADLRDPRGGAPFTVGMRELRESPGAQAILGRCLAMDPFQRFANAMELDAALEGLEKGHAPPIITTTRVETGRERVSRLLDEAAALVKEKNLAAAEGRLAEVLTLSPREERYFFLISEVREGQDRLIDAIKAQKEGNSIVTGRRVDGRTDRVLLERLARLYERAGKQGAAEETRRTLEKQA